MKAGRPRKNRRRVNISTTLPEWKEKGIKELAKRKTLNFSGLVEKLLTEYFGNELEEFKPIEKRGEKNSDEKKPV